MILGFCSEKQKIQALNQHSFSSSSWAQFYFFTWESSTLLPIAATKPYTMISLVATFSHILPLLWHGSSMRCIRYVLHCHGIHPLTFFFFLALLFSELFLTLVPSSSFLPFLKYVSTDSVLLTWMTDSDLAFSVSTVELSGACYVQNRTASDHLSQRPPLKPHY